LFGWRERALKGRERALKGRERALKGRERALLVNTSVLEWRPWALSGWIKRAPLSWRKRAMMEFNALLGWRENHYLARESGGGEALLCRRERVLLGLR
jgi:hypothetical protein